METLLSFSTKNSAFGVVFSRIRPPFGPASTLSAASPAGNPAQRTPSSVMIFIFIVLCVRCPGRSRGNIGIVCLPSFLHPLVKRRQQNEREESRADDSANHNRGQRTLHLSSCTAGNRHR